TVLRSQASETMEIVALAKRIGDVHPAQIQANIELMQREHIERGRAITMMETFAQRRDEFLIRNSQFRKSILDDVEGPFVEVVQRHFRELAAAPDISTQMNLVRRFSEQIDEYCTKHPELGGKARGAQEKRKYLERWFGLPDMMQLTTDFVKISKEAE